MPVLDQEPPRPAARPEIQPHPEKEWLTVTGRTARKVRLLDRLADFSIRFGGSLVIIAVAAIFLFIGKEALPLFLPASSEQALSQKLEAPLPLPDQGPQLLGMDDYETFAYWLNETGAIQMVTLPDWQPHVTLPIAKLAGRTVTTTYRSPARDYLYLGTEDGQVLLTQMKFRPIYSESGRVIESRVDEGYLFEVSPDGHPIISLYARDDGDGYFYIAAMDAQRNFYAGLFEEGEEVEFQKVGGYGQDEITCFALDSAGVNLFAASRQGKLYQWDMESGVESPLNVLQPGNADRHVTAMEFLIGEVSLILGFNDGSLEQWFGVRETEEATQFTFSKIRGFESLGEPIQRLAVSGRDKGFLAAGQKGGLNLYFATSARTMLKFHTEAQVAGLVYSPRLTRVLATTTEQKVFLWDVDNPHPEISWSTLFGKVWYEGYSKPEYVWQSTGGSDDFEPKLSLVPLTLGTLKGAFYGLLFAIPVAVLAAIYASQFMSWRLRAVVKPAVEIMAGLPSVVIGFLAGLWLAPLLETHVLSIASMVVVIPFCVLLAVIGWGFVPGQARSRLPFATELAIISIMVLIGGFLSIKLGPAVESWWFGGDLRQWIFAQTGEQFEQRNSIIIGFAMGFAVIPIIFTISEDALSNVPQHFVSGSLALGASRWQTAIRIILPTASPGIFSAVMVGFGRAVGETMIVLMATGNTPILSFNPFNGMRTLSANIAVEIPEAPIGGSLYRILFLTAILLFALTFAVNTVAEIIRQRLRDKYKAV